MPGLMAEETRAVPKFDSEADEVVWRYRNRDRISRGPEG